MGWLWTSSFPTKKGSVPHSWLPSAMIWGSFYRRGMLPVSDPSLWAAQCQNLLEIQNLMVGFPAHGFMDYDNPQYGKTNAELVITQPSFYWPISPYVAWSKTQFHIISPVVNSISSSTRGCEHCSEGIPKGWWKNINPSQSSSHYSCIPMTSPCFMLKSRIVLVRSPQILLIHKQLHDNSMSI